MRRLPCLRLQFVVTCPEAVAGALLQKYVCPRYIILMRRTGLGIRLKFTRLPSTKRRNENRLGFTNTRARGKAVPKRFSLCVRSESKRASGTCPRPRVFKAGATVKITFRTFLSDRLSNFRQRSRYEETSGYVPSRWSHEPNNSIF